VGDEVVMWEFMLMRIGGCAWLWLWAMGNHVLACVLA